MSLCFKRVQIHWFSRNWAWLVIVIIIISDHIKAPTVNTCILINSVTTCVWKESFTQLTTSHYSHTLHLLLTIQQQTDEVRNCKPDSQKLQTNVVQLPAGGDYISYHVFSDSQVDRKSVIAELKPLVTGGNSSRYGLQLSGQHRVACVRGNAASYILK